MNIRIVDEYSKNDNLNILKEECAELITAASHLQRARGDGYATHRTEEESMKDLMQAMAARCSTFQLRSLTAFIEQFTS